MGVQQVRDPLERARSAGELMDRLRRVTNTELADIRQKAIAEAVQWPNMSMGKVATELSLSKSAVAKLANPKLRTLVANDLRERLTEGIVLPLARDS